MMMGAAGRDPRAFVEPDRFRLDRGEKAWDIGFGRGTHYCLGHAVAEAEMVEAITLLTSRLKDVAIDGEVHFAPAGSRMWGPEVLPLRFRLRS
jgi:cytochrome P450